MAAPRQSEGDLLARGLGIGIVLFTGFGVALAITTDNLGLLGIGPAMGVAVGVAIGRGMIDRARKEGRLAPEAPSEPEPDVSGQRRHVVLGSLAVVGLIIAATVIVAALLR